MKKVLIALVVTFLGFGMSLSAVSSNWDHWYLLSGVMDEDDENVAEDYEVVPVVLGVEKDITTQVNDFLPWNMWGELDFVVEGFMGPVVSPDSNLEVGCGIGLLWIPLKYKDLSFYVRVSSGPGYTTQHTDRQGSQWNFFSWAGVGVQWGLMRDLYGLVELRYRHFSNAGIKKPNKGVNNCGVFAGIKRDF